MKRIVILCDGTWMSSDHAHPTNVVRLAQAVAHTAPDGVKQVVHYVRGVGTGRGTGLAARLTDRLGGGAFGWGLMANVEEAYRFLVFAYEPGDEIHIFGFSRGAFTARSLAGLIRSSGIVSRENVWMIPEAVARYRSGAAKTAPDSEETHQFRLRWSPDVHTSRAEAQWRRDLPGVGEGHRLRIAYLGVWDTVGALGVPATFGLLARLFNRGTAFHDAALSSCVAAARHAVAIDETRKLFPPALWTNIDALNRSVHASGHQPDYEQVWFPGDHASVGGGGDVVGLSSAALLWVARGAQRRGLALREAHLGRIETDIDHRAPLAGSSKRRIRLSILQRDRKGPTCGSQVSGSARARWRDTAACRDEAQRYRPPALAGVETILLADLHDERREPVSVSPRQVA